ncbi:MAG: hypothetical protein HOI95_21410 [Chromatiales bacterium]|nr:hypothetical protein [Chromatiales bacterium]
MFYVTGGGSELISEMLTTPGASRTVLEASVPYAASALAATLGRAPDQSCSAPTVRAMAMAAFQRAVALAPDTASANLFGMSCTASLATDREKRGRHRAHIALQTDSSTHFAEIDLRGDRVEEERQLLDALWTFLLALLDGQAAGAVAVRSTRAEDAWRDVLLGRQQASATKPHDGKLILSGAFNPLHYGHQKMLAVAERLTGRAGAFELSIVNVDKPPLDYHEIALRLAQFDVPVWLTCLPTFIEKARHFPGAIFGVGVDTITRIDAPRYYEGEARRDAAIEELAGLGCEFLVFGRAQCDGFIELAELELSDGLTDLCRAVPADAFREDISSTQLRRHSAGD